MKINWNERGVPLYFNDIVEGEAFTINSGRSKGTVYLKIVSGETHCEYMLELGTGKFWEPTESQIKIVEMEVNIAANKPSHYN